MRTLLLLVMATLGLSACDAVTGSAFLNSCKQDGVNLERQCTCADALTDSLMADRSVDYLVAVVTNDLNAVAELESNMGFTGTMSAASEIDEFIKAANQQCGYRDPVVVKRRAELDAERQRIREDRQRLIDSMKRK